jgi:RNA polymerase sigma-B factor
MKQSALLRDWEWLQDQVIPPLVESRDRQSKQVWSIGSMEDAIAVTVAFADSVGVRQRDGLRAYVSGCRPPTAPISFASADLGSVPPASRAAWFRPEQRRWVPQPAIADQVIMGEPDGLVDLVTLRTVGDLDAGPDAPAHSRLKRGGYLLVVEPSAAVPTDLRPVDDEGRLFQRVTAPGDNGGAAVVTPIDPTDTLARHQWQQELVNQHINLARSLARRFLHRGEPADDLEQVAFLALIKAARRFDPGYQNAFSTYATVSILGELKRHFRDKTWMLRVPRSTQELYLSIKDAREELGHQLGRSPTLEDIAVYLGVGVDQVIEATEAGGTYWPASLDVYGPDGERTVDVPVADASLDGAIDRQQLRALLPRLNDRERLILKRIYFDGETQQRVAEEIGASQMQVSRLLARTLGKLRRWCNEDGHERGDRRVEPHQRESLLV